MRTIFGFLLPLLISAAPLVYLLYFGNKRIQLGNGNTIFQTGGFALLFGLITPIIAMVTSITMLSMFDQNTAVRQCYTFVTGFIGIGILIEIIVIPVTIILTIAEEAKKNIN